MDAVTTANCQYRQLDNGIHYFEVAGDGRIPVDEFFELRNQVQQQITEPLVRTLIVLKMVRLPSINYVIAQVKAFDARFTNHPPSRSAIIYRQGMLIFVLNNFLRLFVKSRDKVQFFTENEIDKATDWLLKDE